MLLVFCFVKASRKEFDSHFQWQRMWVKQNPSFQQEARMNEWINQSKEWMNQWINQSKEGIQKFRSRSNQSWRAGLGRFPPDAFFHVTDVIGSSRNNRGCFTKIDQGMYIPKVNYLIASLQNYSWMNESCDLIGSIVRYTFLPVWHIRAHKGCWKQVRLFHNSSFHRGSAKMSFWEIIARQMRGWVSVCVKWTPDLGE